MGIFIYLQTGLAQIYVKSMNQQLIENAVKDAFFISKNSFQVQDKDGKRFGIRNNNEFGTEMTLGVKIQNGAVLSNRAIHPWDYDSKFEKYKKDYSPVLSKSVYSELKDTAHYQSFDISKEQKVLIDSVIYQQYSDVFGGKGLSTDSTSGEKEGWLIWVVVKKEADLSQTAKAEFIVLRSKQQIQAQKGGVSLDKPLTEERIMGGIYVVPHFPEVGVVNLKISGVMVEKESNWILYFPFVNAREIIDSNSFKEKEDETNELTPVTNNNSVKK